MDRRQFEPRKLHYQPKFFNPSATCLADFSPETIPICTITGLPLDEDLPLFESLPFPLPLPLPLLLLLSLPLLPLEFDLELESLLFRPLLLLLFRSLLLPLFPLLFLLLLLLLRPLLLLLLLLPRLLLLLSSSSSSSSSLLLLLFRLRRLLLLLLDRRWLLLFRLLFPLLPVLYMPKLGRGMEKSKPKPWALTKFDPRPLDGASSGGAKSCSRSANTAQGPTRSLSAGPIPRACLISRPPFSTFNFRLLVPLGRAPARSSVLTYCCSQESQRTESKERRQIYAPTLGLVLISPSSCFCEGKSMHSRSGPQLSFGTKVSKVYSLSNERSLAPRRQLTLASEAGPALAARFLPSSWSQFRAC